MDFSKIKTNALLAELIGTFGLAGAVLASINGMIAVPTAVIAGLTLSLFVLSVGKISGCHINPAVTMGLWSVKKINSATAISYIVAQVTGALAALATMEWLVAGDAKTAGGAGAFDWKVLLAEAIGMAVFTFGIAGAVHNKLEDISAAWLIGFSLFIGISFAAVASNGVLNPAVAAAIDSLSWAYILGPVIGSIIGMNLYQYAVAAKGKL